MKCVLSLLFLIAVFQANAQKVTYSSHITEDNHQITFEILGKVGSGYMIYKSVRWKHMLAIYDQEMRLQENMRLAYIPEKTFNLDFITYPEYFYTVFQYQKKNTIFCKAVKIDSKGNKVSEPVLLDTARVGLTADKKIYNTTFSEDKSKILVYKMQRKNEKLTLVAKVFNNEFTMLDSSRYQLPFDERKDVYSDLFIDNNGTIVYTKGLKKGWRQNISEAEVLVKPLLDTVSKIKIPLSGKYADEMKVRIDNLNGTYIINTLYSSAKEDEIEGLFTVVVERNKPVHISKAAFNQFDNNIRAKINTGMGTPTRTAFDDLFIRNTIVRKDGGFVLTAEDYSPLYNNATTPWRRYDNLYNSPYGSSYDYYLNSPSYYNNYRPWRNYLQRSIRHYYNDILVMSFDSSLKAQWHTIIPKKQADDNSDNFLSYALMNAGAELHFLYIENDKKNQIITNRSILPDGEMKRYPTLKSYEAGYEFMPKMAKQIGPRQVIIPCMYRGYITFAKVDFSE